MIHTVKLALSEQAWWSRRITLEDRLVYRVAGSADGQRLEWRNAAITTDRLKLEQSWNKVPAWTS